MSSWFFFSYARADRDPYMVKFHDDLANEVRLNAGETTSADIGFFDSQDIEPGEEWPEKLAQALQSTRVLLSLYSPRYFASEYCGKEWSIFQSRIYAYLQSAPARTPRPPLIIPVLWARKESIDRVIPDTVSDVQFFHQDFGDVYAEEGLRFLSMLDKHQDDYRVFLNRLATKIVQGARDHPLPASKNLPDIRRVSSAFSIQGSNAPSPDAQLSAAYGPRYVQFVFVAARKDELHSVRNDVAAYGIDGGLDWRPFHPDVEQDVGILAQDVIQQLDLPDSQRLHYQVLPASGNIVEEINEAKNRNIIVVIVVDTHTLQLAQYRQPMYEYDSRDFWNCVVLIPWNLADPETVDKIQSLDDHLRQTFPTKTIKSDRYLIRDPERIKSAEDLRREIQESLLTLRNNILFLGEVSRPVDRTVAKPTVTAISQRADL